MLLLHYKQKKSILQSQQITALHTQLLTRHKRTKTQHSQSIPLQTQLHTNNAISINELTSKTSNPHNYTHNTQSNTHTLTLDISFPLLFDLCFCVC